MQSFTDFTAMSPQITTESILNTTLEMSISCERNYRECILELYRTIYPAIKYDDIGILKESVNCTKQTVKSFNTVNIATIESSYRKAINQVNFNFSTYTKLAKRVMDTNIPMDNSYNVKIPWYTYIYGIPVIHALTEIFEDITDDYRIFTSSNAEAIIKLRNSESKYIKQLVASVLDMNKCPDNPNAYFYDVLRNGDKKVATTLNREFITDRASKSSKYTNMIKDATKTMQQYIRLIDRYHSVILSYFSDDITNDDIMGTVASYVDSNASFLMFELKKFSDIVQAVTPLIMCKIEAINDELLFDIDVLSQYMHGAKTSDNVIITIEEGCDYGI